MTEVYTLWGQQTQLTIVCKVVVEKSTNKDGVRSKDEDKKFSLLHRVQKMASAWRVVAFFAVVFCVPVLLIVLPLHARYTLYPARVIPTVPSDTLDLHTMASSFWCQGQRVSSNGSFDAYLLPSTPRLERTRRRVTSVTDVLKISEILPEMKPLHLLQGSHLDLAVCSRWPGGQVILVRGSKNFDRCFYREDRELGRYEEMILRRTQLDNEKKRKSELDQNTTRSGLEKPKSVMPIGNVDVFNDESDVSDGRELFGGDLVEFNGVGVGKSTKKSGEKVEADSVVLSDEIPINNLDYEQSVDVSKSLFGSKGESKNASVELVDDLKHLNDDEEFEDENSLTSTTIISLPKDIIKSGRLKTIKENDTITPVGLKSTRSNSRRRRSISNRSQTDLTSRSISNRQNQLKSTRSNSRRRRSISNRPQTDLTSRSISNRQNLDDGSDEETEKEAKRLQEIGVLLHSVNDTRDVTAGNSSFSSSEEFMEGCVDTIARIPMNSSVGCVGSDVSSVERLFSFEINETDEYYLIFMSDNTIEENIMKYHLKIDRVMFNISEKTKSCNDARECVFPFEFLGNEAVVVEMAGNGVEMAGNEVEMAGNEFEKLNRLHTFQIQLICQPRVAVYMIFILLVPLIILLFAFQ